VALLVAYGVVLWLSALVWIYRDIKIRTNDLVSQLVSVFLVLIFNVPGLLLYLILRPPETLSEAYERALEAEAMLQELERLETCPSCQRRIEEGYLLCPYCRTRLRQACGECGRPLSFGWVVCPFCGTERAAATAAEAAASPVGAAPSAARSPARARRVRARTGSFPAETEPLS
jgi:uncharacterized Zn finger protein (UPF0148 family)